jgi:FlaA1/EpsC-like NDP-sugar epimerase
VLGSRCSIIPVIRQQVKEGGPVTITQTEATRFIMSICEAVNLVIKASMKTQGGEIFVLKMPVVRIVDLIEVLVEELSPLYGKKPSDIEIKKIPLRRGEKIHEDLLTQEESLYAHDCGDMFVIEYSNGQGGGVPVYTSAKEQVLSKQAIKDLLKREGLICLNKTDSAY